MRETFQVCIFEAVVVQALLGIRRNLPGIFMRHGKLNLPGQLDSRVRRPDLASTWLAGLLGTMTSAKSRFTNALNNPVIAHHTLQ